MAPPRPGTPRLDENLFYIIVFTVMLYDYSFIYIFHLDGLIMIQLTVFLFLNILRKFMF